MLKYVVKRTSPSYLVAREQEGSALTLFALSRDRMIEPSIYSKLLKSRPVASAIRQAGIAKAHLRAARTPGSPGAARGRSSASPAATASRGRSRR